MDSDDLFTRAGSTGDRLGDTLGTSDLFGRQFGAELAGWELRLQERFCEPLPGRQYIHRGFVHHTRNNSILLLTPSPWLLSGVFLCLREDMEPPPDGAFIETTDRRIALPLYGHTSNTEFVEAYLVDSLREQRLDVIHDVSPPLSLNDLTRLLFEDVGMAEASKGVFARLFVSSPPYIEGVGGLTMGIQAMAARREVQRLLNFIRAVLPSDLRGKWAESRKIRGIQVFTPRGWRMEVGTVPELRIRQLCLERKDPSGFREVSLSTLTDPSNSSMPDIPIAVASEDFWVDVKTPKRLQLPVLKAAITFQLLTPTVTSNAIDDATKYVLTRIEHLKDSFGLGDTALTRGSVLDADALGRPLSVLRLARSTARANWREKIGLREIKNAWDRILEPALTEFIELTKIKEESEREWRDDRRYERFNTKVLRALKRLDTDVSSGALGPTVEEIAREAGVEPHVARTALEKMKEAGAVYEPRHGHFRLV